MREVWEGNWGERKQNRRKTEKGKYARTKSTFIDAVKIFEAFICCRLLFWQLRALAAGLTGARQKQLVQFWLPGRLWAPIIFEAFICCRLLFWRLRALAAGLTGARQKQLVQFWLPGRLWAPIIPAGFAKTLPLGFRLKPGVARLQASVAA